MTTYPGDLLLHLESFVALVARAERRQPAAFERAARDLRVDRSVLRRRIHTLEAWAGAPILEGRGVELRLTARGARLAERAARLVDAAQALPAEIAAARDRVVVACTGTITTELLPGVVVALEKRPRPVQLVIRRAGGALCESLVRSGDVDVGVVRAERAPRGVDARHLADDRLWFVLPRHHALAARARLSVEEMATVPLVLFGEASRTRARVMERLAPHGASIRVEVEGRAAALEYVRAGIGATFLSLLPRHAVAATGVRARDVTASFAPSRFFVVTRRDRATEVVADVVDTLVRAVSARASPRRGGAPPA